MIIASCLINLLPKNINQPLGRIRDVYSDNEVEMKDMQKEPETVVISVDPEKAEQPEVIATEKKEPAAEVLASVDAATVPDTVNPVAAQANVSNDDSAQVNVSNDASAQEKQTDDNVPSGVTSQ